MCQATGDPKPRITWMKKGKKVSSQRFEVQLRVGKGRQGSRSAYFGSGPISPRLDLPPWGPFLGKRKAEPERAPVSVLSRL